MIYIVVLQLIGGNKLVSQAKQQCLEMPSPPKIRRVAVLGSRAIVKYKGEEFAAEIIDTAGQDEFSILNSKHAIGIHGYVLVYSIASRQSFEMCKIVRDKILNFTGIDWVPIVLVANKVDLHAQRQVTTEEAHALAAEWNCAVIETSAKHNPKHCQGV
ncbi:hypothetical protein BASA60_004531 [Batrachochytrium salamandrivorans]|nr:hypothetical protein BASA60_004531 [Batrachochytrium salamandrivorans]